MSTSAGWAEKDWAGLSGSCRCLYYSWQTACKPESISWRKRTFLIQYSTIPKENLIKTFFHRPPLIASPNVIDIALSHKHVIGSCPPHTRPVAVVTHQLPALCMNINGKGTRGWPMARKRNTAAWKDKDTAFLFFIS